ncbi:MAG TPA: hypothetical protein VFZ26_09430 [Gemmatimonadales bacterium]
MVSPDAGRLKREVLTLLGLVLVVDAVFVAGYVLGHVARGSDGLKLGYTALWTVATLAVVLRGLTRIRAERVRRARRQRGGE